MSPRLLPGVGGDEVMSNIDIGSMLVLMGKRYQSLWVHMVIIGFNHIVWKGDTAEEAEGFEWNERIREVEQGLTGRCTCSKTKAVAVC
jgi:hypothetical protein